MPMAGSMAGCFLRFGDFYARSAREHVVFAKPLKLLPDREYIMATRPALHAR